jgi:hypothetical protein
MTSEPQLDQSQPAGDQDDFAKQAEQESVGLIREFLSFLAHNKKWWLLPILVVLVLLSVLIVAFGNPAIAPFIYTIF